MGLSGLAMPSMKRGISRKRSVTSLIVFPILPVAMHGVPYN